jgi:drug/metabolite transporter (DMT)-like permease
MRQQGLSPALWMVLACVGMACISGMIKHISTIIPTLEIVFFRNFFGLIALAPWFWQNGIEGLRTKRIGLLAVRATTGLISTTAWFLALAVLPLADATALTFTAPLFATVGAVFFLSEVVHLRRWVATLIGFTGAMIILRPGLQGFEPANFYAVLAAASLAVGGIAIKKLTTTESPTKCVAWAHLMMTPVSLLPALFVWQWPQATTWLWLICLGVATAITHVSMARAIGMGDLTAVLPYDFTRLPFAAMIGYFAFNQIPDIWTWTGAGIIFISSIYITHRETKSVPQHPLGP